MSGYYIPVEEMSKCSHAFPSFFKNRMYASRPFELCKVVLLELKQHAVCVHGLPIDQLPVEVSLQEVNEQLFENINQYWAGWAMRYGRRGIPNLQLVLFPYLAEWALTGVARQLYTLQTGRITSKLKAAKYCLHLLPASMQDIMQSAITTRQQNTRSISIQPSLSRPKKTIACMQWIINEFNHQYRAAGR